MKHTRFLFHFVFILVACTASGQSLHEIMNPTNGEADYRKLISASKSDGDRKKTYFGLIRLGFFFTDRGKIIQCDSVLNEIERNFKDMITTKAKWGSLDVSDYYFLLSSYFFLKNDIQRSKAVLKAAIKIDPHNVFASEYLFRMFVNEGKLDSAERFVQTRFRELAKDFDVGDKQVILFESVFRNMCQLKVLQRDPNGLYYYLAKWLSINTAKSGDPDQMKESRFATLSVSQLIFLSKYYGFRGNYEKALKMLGYVNKVSLRGLDYDTQLERLRSYAEIHYANNSADSALVFMKQLLDIHEENVRTLFPTFTESERENYVNALNTDFDVFLSIVSDNAVAAENYRTTLFNFQLFRKGLLLNTSRQMARITSRLDNPQAILLTSKIAMLKDSIALVTLHSQTIDDGRRSSHLAALNNEKEQYERQVLQIAYQGGASLLDSIKVQNVAAALSPESCLLEQIRFTKWERGSDHLLIRRGVAYMALVLSGKGDIQTTLLENGNDIEQRYARLYNNSIQAQLGDSVSYGVFWKPYLGNVGNFSKVYLSADGVYNLINVNTLQDPKTGKYVLDQQQVINITSGKDLVAAEREKKLSGEALLLGFPSYNFEMTATTSHGTTRGGFLEELENLQTTEFAPLPATRFEIEEISNILSEDGSKPTVFMGTDATEANLKSAKIPSILHLATHGFFISGTAQGSLVNPLLKSGLILAGANNRNKASDDEDGILTAFEISSLDLRNTELVVLSACETGRGEIRNGDGVYGLQRAFKAAESRFIVTSLWKVDDEATMKLMTLFYRSLGSTHDVISSFQLAQKELRKSYPSPYYWGAFKLIGN